MNPAVPGLKVTFLLGVALLVGQRNFHTSRAQEAPDPERAANTSVLSGTNEVAVAAITTAPPAVEKKLSSRLLELLKMAERGLGDDVLIAWVKNSPTAFSLTPDDIVYLTDVGISETVVRTLIEHQGIGSAPPNTPVQAAPPLNPSLAQPSPNQPPLIPNAAPPVAITATPEFETAPQVPQAQAPITYAEQSAPVQDNYFYSPLAPYGSWIEVPDYGLCWRPTVAVIDTGWRPYCQRGRWLYTNCGWYWQSDYSWGWAPFHYGRWWNHPHCGWVWAPDNVWSPAWVTWRYSDAFCGWAPLPPGCGYRTGIGLTYHSAGVSAGFDFGLGHKSFTFVAAPHFYDRAPWRYALAPHQVVNVYDHTTVINNITHNPNNTLVNEGPGRDRIARITRSEIQKINIREVPAEGSRHIQSDRLERGGKELTVYRPLNPTVPPEGSSGSLARHEIAKSPAAMSPRPVMEKGQSPARTIGSNRTAGPPAPASLSGLSPANSRAPSLGNAPALVGPSGKTERLTEASLSRSAVEDRESPGPASRRTLNNSVPVVRAPSTSTVLPQTRQNDSSPTVLSKPSIEQRTDTISSTRPRRSYAPINPASDPETSRVVASPPSMNRQPSIISRRAINSPVPATTPNSQATYEEASARPTPATATPAYRQEVTKPIIVSSPQPQNYYAPVPATRIAPQNVPIYSSGQPNQSVPYSSSGQIPVPQPSRASPVYSAPRPQSAPPSSTPRAVTSQQSGGSGRSDRSNTR